MNTIKVQYLSGQSRNGNDKVDYMLAVYYDEEGEEYELYDEEYECETYARLRRSIELQAEVLGVENRLVFE